jgi:hypothetical protein
LVGPKIFIDLDKIQERGISLKLVLLHEFGHCQFGLKDIEAEDRAFDDNGCVENIMMNGGKEERCEIRFWEYVEQIKGG